MRYQPLSGDDHSLVRQILQRAFDVNALMRLVVAVNREMAMEVNWGAALAPVVFDVIEKAQNHGVLDRVIAAAAAERPFVLELRAMVLYLCNKYAWTKALEAHGMDFKSGLEQLTSAGNPFIDTTDGVPRRGVASGIGRRAVRHCRADQRATAGRLMRGSSLNWPTLSSVM